MQGAARIHAILAREAVTAVILIGASMLRCTGRFPGTDMTSDCLS